MMIHDAPAIRLAASAITCPCAEPYSARAMIVPMVPSAARRSGPRRALRPLSAERPEDRTHSDHAEQGPVDRRPVMHLHARNQGQKRPIGAREREEGDGADERRIDVAIVPCVAQPRAQRAGKALGRQALPRPARSAPPQERRHEPHIADAKAPERQVDAEGGNRQSAKRRADRATHIVARIVDRDGAVEIVLGNQHRRDDEPRRRRKRAGCAERKRGRQQHGRRRPMQGDDGREHNGYRCHGKLHADQEPARIDDVGQHAGRQGHKKHRQRGRDLDRRNHHRIRIEVGHQPAR